MPVNGSTYAPCTGEGKPATGEDPGRYGNGLCPDCGGIANVDRVGDGIGTRFIIDTHTVKIIDCGGDD